MLLNLEWVVVTNAATAASNRGLSGLRSKDALLSEEELLITGVVLLEPRDFRSWSCWPGGVMEQRLRMSERTVGHWTFLTTRGTNARSSSFPRL